MDTIHYYLYLIKKIQSDKLATIRAGGMDWIGRMYTWRQLIENRYFVIDEQNIA